MDRGKYSRYFVSRRPPPAVRKIQSPPFLPGLKKKKKIVVLLKSMRLLINRVSDINPDPGFLIFDRLKRNKVNLFKVFEKAVVFL